MRTQATSSNLSEAMLRRRKLEKAFLENQLLTIDRDRNKTRLNMDRHKESFLQLNRKRHETWYRYDKHFRDALNKDKERLEKRRQRCGSSTNVNIITFPSLVTINSLPEPMTKVEQRTYRVLRESQKLIDESSVRSKSSGHPSRTLASASTYKSSSIATGFTAFSTTSTNFTGSMTQSIEFEEYHRLMNESLQHENYSNFVDHFVKFCPEFREKFAQFHQNLKRKLALEQQRKFNAMYAKTKDQRYHDLLTSLTDFRLGKKTSIK